jgi:hypothetical protein
MILAQRQARGNGSFGGGYNFSIREQEVCLIASSAMARGRLLLWEICRRLDCSLAYAAIHPLHGPILARTFWS